MTVPAELLSQLVEALAETVADRVVARLRPGAELLGPRDVGVSARTWRAAIARGELPAVKVGRELRAKRQEVEAWLASRAVKPAPERATRARRLPRDEVRRGLLLDVEAGVLAHANGKAAPR